MEKRRTKPDEREHFRAHTGAECPIAPVIDVHFKIEMDEPIAQRRGHGEVRHRDPPRDCRRR